MEELDERDDMEEREEAGERIDTHEARDVIVEGLEESGEVGVVRGVSEAVLVEVKEDVQPCSAATLCCTRYSSPYSPSCVSAFFIYSPASDPKESLLNLLK